jgi:hypothetical protein
MGYITSNGRVVVMNMEKCGGNASRIILKCCYCNAASFRIAEIRNQGVRNTTTERSFRKRQCSYMYITLEMFQLNLN